MLETLLAGSAGCRRRRDLRGAAARRPTPAVAAGVATGLLLARLGRDLPGGAWSRSRRRGAGDEAAEAAGAGRATGDVGSRAASAGAAWLGYATRPARQRSARVAAALRAARRRDAPARGLRWLTGADQLASRVRDTLAEAWARPYPLSAARPS